VISSALDALNPGGFLEFHDFVIPLRSIDDSLQGTAFQSWQEKTFDAADKLGTSWRNSANYSRYLEEAGFVDVVEKHFQWPINPWAKGARMKTIGAYCQENILRGMEALSMAVLTRGAGMTKEEVMELTAAAKRDVPNRDIHAYVPL
jgi:hypothetical protein